MPLLSPSETLRGKIKSLPVPEIKKLAALLRISSKGNGEDVSTRIVESNPDGRLVDQYIRLKYAEVIECRRRNVISDADLRIELMSIPLVKWGVVQGQLDQKIQAHYVRPTPRYAELLKRVEDSLVDEVRNYVIRSWFNHWTTRLIEDHISSHPRVVPTVKHIKGTDIFFDGQPFDLKITDLPSGFDPKVALQKPADLAVWLYENQGPQRFGDDNRFFVVLMDEADLLNSWQLKRDFDLIFPRIDEFLDRESVSGADRVTFTLANSDIRRSRKS